MSEALEGPFPPGFIKLIVQAHSYCIGQSMAEEAIRHNFPNLGPALQRAEILFDAGTGNVCRTAADTLVAAVGAENAQAVTRKTRDQVEKLNMAPDQATAQGFIQEVEARSRWTIDEENLLPLLALRYGANPADEFADGHVALYEGNGDPKLLGEALRLKLPLSWTEKPGERPHIVRKWVDQVGTGLNMIMLTVQDYGQPLGPQELAEITSADPREGTPEGATYLDGGSFVLEGLSGVRVRVRMSTQRLELKMDQIVDQYMLPLPSGRIIVLGCYVGAEASDASGLQRRFDRIEPLCREVVNSLVVTSLY